MNSDIFCCLFLLNETMHFSQKGVVSYTVHEKKNKRDRNGVVLLALWVFFFPWTHDAGEEEDFFFLYHHHLSLQKDVDSLSKICRPTPLAHKHFPRVGGAATHCTAPVSLPFFLPIKTREKRAEKKRREKKKKRESRREGGRNEETRKKKSRKKEKKNRGGRRRRRSSIAGHSSPQPPLAAPCNHHRQQHRLDATTGQSSFLLLLRCQPPVFT